MFKKSAVEKRLRKISKQEALNVKLLEKQEQDLEKALQENEKMIEKSESKLSPGEVRLQQEVERLSRKLSQLTTELDQLQSKREEELSPLRTRGRDLSDKLEAVRSQLVSARGVRERSLSLSSLDMKKSSPPLGMTSYSPITPSVPPPPYNEDHYNL